MIKRVDWIDIVKGIGILLMVIGHAGNIPNVKLWIYSFHMPLFFIMAGYVFGLSNNKYIGASGVIKLAKRNSRAYILPYVMLFTINLIVKLLFDVLKEPRIDGLWEKASHYFVYGLLYSYDTELPNCAPLWFLTCLFMAYFWFLGIIYLKNHNRGLLGLICLFVVSIVVTRAMKYIGIDELPWHVEVAVMASVFMFFGLMLYENQGKLDGLNNQSKTGVIAVCALIGTVVAIANGRVNMVKNIYNNEMMFLISAVLISFSLIYAIRLYSDKLPMRIRNIFILWGRNTLIFLGFNYMINTVVSHVFRFVGMENTVVYSITDVVLVMVGCSIMALMLAHIRTKHHKNGEKD